MSRLQHEAVKAIPYWWLAGIAAALVAMMLVVIVSPAFAGHGSTSIPGSNFEIDANANLKVDHASPSIDWLNNAGTAMRAGVVVRSDQPSGSGDDSFKGGVKEDTECPGIDSGSIPPNKSDLKEFGVYVEENGGKFVHLFWTRVQDPSGSTNMDFEFNQSSTLCANGVTPVRTQGDLLLQYDLVSGGSQATLSKRTWNATTGSWGPAVALSGNAIGSINTSAIPASESGGLGSLSARTFGEASVDLALLLDSTVCQSFGSAYLKSRASAQFNSALKDFIAPTAVNITNCADVTVSKVDDAEAPISGVEFTIFEDDAGTMSSTVATDEDGNDLICTTDATGTCSFGAVPAGTYWIDETDGPSGYNKDSDLPYQFTVVANQDLDLGPFVNPRQTGRIVILKVDDNDDPLGGAEFTITPGDIVMTEVETGLFCTDGLLFDDYTVTESDTPAGYEGGDPVDVTVDSEADCDDVTAEDSDVETVVNTLILYRLIVITCDGDGNLVVSSVDIDGTSRDTIAAAPGGLTATQLCGLGGASFDLEPNNIYQADVELPKSP